MDDYYLSLENKMDETFGNSNKSQSMNFSKISNKSKNTNISKIKADLNSFNQTIQKNYQEFMKMKK